MGKGPQKKRVTIHQTHSNSKYPYPGSMGRVEPGLRAAKFVLCRSLSPSLRNYNRSGATCTSAKSAITFRGDGRREERGRGRGRERDGRRGTRRGNATNVSAPPTAIFLNWKKDKLKEAKTKQKKIFFC